MVDYVSTDCRVGAHESCQALQVVPHCACLCHRADAASEMSAISASGAAPLSPGTTEFFQDPQ